MAEDPIYHYCYAVSAMDSWKYVNVVWGASRKLTYLCMFHICTIHTYVCKYIHTYVNTYLHGNSYVPYVYSIRWDGHTETYMYILTTILQHQPVVLLGSSVCHPMSWSAASTWHRRWLKHTHTHTDTRTRHKCWFTHTHTDTDTHLLACMYTHTHKHRHTLPRYIYTHA